MLRPQDCVNGTKVICILQDDDVPVMLQIGAEYTVNDFSPVFWDTVDHVLVWNSISVRELPFLTIEDENYIPFFSIKCFKLKEENQDSTNRSTEKQLEDA